MKLIDFANLDTDLATLKDLQKNTTKVKGVKVVDALWLKFCKPTSSEEKHTDKLVVILILSLSLKERRKKQHHNKMQRH
jgi:hypothetical protein